VEFIQDKGGEAEELFKRKRIDDLELSRRNPKSRGPSDRGGVAREITREHRCGEPKSIGHRGIGIRGWRGKSFMHVEIANSDFPNLIGAVDHQRDTWHRSRGVGIRSFGIVCAKSNGIPTRFPDNRGGDRSAKSRVCVGIPDHRGSSGW
jgi:hypothetical protein